MERGVREGTKVEARLCEGTGESFHIIHVETIGQFPKWLPPKHVKEEPEKELLSQSWEAQWQDFLKTAQSPHSGAGSPQLPTGTVPWGETKMASIPTEERTAINPQTGGGEQTSQLGQGFQEPAKQVYNLPDSGDGGNYGKAKGVSQGVLSADQERRLFREFSYREAEGPQEIYRQLYKLCYQWLKPEKRTKEQMVEVLIMEQFLAILPPDMQKWVKERGPDTSAQAVALAEDFLLRQQENGSQGEEVLGLIPEVAVSFLDAERASSEAAQRRHIREIKTERGKEACLLGGDGWMSDRDGESQGMTSQRTHGVELEESLGNQDKSEQDEWRRKSIAGKEGSICEITLQQRMYKGKGRSLCTMCGKSFSTKSSFNRHQRIHTGEKPYKCPDCSESFLARSNLIRHQRIHTGEKPYKCSDCGKRFSRSANLITHRRSHTGEKPYKCSGCGKTFNQSAHLMRHQRTHVREKPYECADCGKGFTQGAALSGHQRIHTGEKPYECSDCSMKFRDKSSLNRHRRLHTGEKPYKCLVCWKGFIRRSVLIRHQKAHIGEKICKYSDCGKSFLSLSDLITHQNIHTRDDIL